MGGGTEDAGVRCTPDLPSPDPAAAVAQPPGHGLCTGESGLEARRHENTAQKSGAHPAPHSRGGGGQAPPTWHDSCSSTPPCPSTTRSTSTYSAGDSALHRRTPPRTAVRASRDSCRPGGEGVQGGASQARVEWRSGLLAPACTWRHCQRTPPQAPWGTPQDLQPLHSSPGGLPPHLGNCTSTGGSTCGYHKEASPSGISPSTTQWHQQWHQQRHQQ